MPEVARTNDLVVGLCSHGLPCCPHAVVGYHGAGSGDVRANSRGVQREMDTGVHTCPHCGAFMIIGRSGTVRANGRGVARNGDSVTHFCGSGICAGGSGNVGANNNGR